MKVFGAANITKDIELKYLPSGKAVAKFSIAKNRGYGDKKEVSYFDVVCFDKQAENVNKFCGKGSKVLIDGRLQQRRWEAKDGTKRSSVEIVAFSVEFLDSKPKGNDQVSDDQIPF